MIGWMDGWMNDWMDGWMGDGRLDRWLVGQRLVLLDRSVIRKTNNYDVTIKYDFRHLVSRGQGDNRNCPQLHHSESYHC